MKICLISDIHANLPALKAVVAHARKQGCREIWNMGDSVGYSPYPEETLRYLRRHKVMSLLGNYDLKVLQFKKHEAQWRTSKHPAKFFSFAWTHRTLSPQAKKYLRSFPACRYVLRKKLVFLLVHGTPQCMEEGLHDETPCKRLEEIAKASAADVICCGHSHYYFKKKVLGRTWFVNPGSVGRTPEAKPSASYAVIEIHNGKVSSIRRHKVPYAYKEMLAKMRSLRFPEFLIESVVEE